MQQLLSLKVTEGPRLLLAVFCKYIYDLHIILDDVFQLKFSHTNSYIGLGFPVPIWSSSLPAKTILFGIKC